MSSVNARLYWWECMNDKAVIYNLGWVGNTLMQPYKASLLCVCLCCNLTLKYLLLHCGCWSKELFFSLKRAQTDRTMSATERSLRKREGYTNGGEIRRDWAGCRKWWEIDARICELIIYISIRGWGSGESKSGELEALWLWQEKIDQMSCVHVQREKRGNKRCLACAFEKTND